MGKRIISQARGHGSFTYKVRRRAYKYRLGFIPLNIIGTAKVLKLINSAAHSAPLAKISLKDKVFYIPAAQGIYEGQDIQVGPERAETGDIVPVKILKIGDRIFNIEISPGDGGKMIRTSGGFATVLTKEKNQVIILMANKKQIKIHNECRAVVGIIAGQGRKLKPVVKAGKKHFMMKARNKLWPRTSAVKMNAVDHPFGGGRGKRIKSKIAKRNAPPGAKVGHILPRRTGRKTGGDGL